MALAARLIFITTAAIMAAVVGDAIVEAISNAGILWHGQFTDRSSWNLVPTACIAAAAFVTVVALATWSEISTRQMRERVAMLQISRMLETRHTLRALPITLGLQLSVLFTMETVEQLVVYGRLMSPLLWLGGPAVASICIHTLVGIVCSLLLARWIGKAVRALSELVVRRSPIALSHLYLRYASDDGAARFRQLLLWADREGRGPPAAAHSIAR